MFEEEDLIVEMLEAGARGYLLKNADKKEILEAIYTVNEGNIFYCKHTTAHLASLIVKSKFDSQKKSPGALFTDRGKRDHQADLPAAYGPGDREAALP